MCFEFINKLLNSLVSDEVPDEKHMCVHQNNDLGGGCLKTNKQKRIHLNVIYPINKVLCTYCTVTESASENDLAFCLITIDDVIKLF